jgi:hypothetical protein
MSPQFNVQNTSLNYKWKWLSNIVEDLGVSSLPDIPGNGRGDSRVFGGAEPGSEHSLQ